MSEARHMPSGECVLLPAARAGDVEAFADLYRLHYDGALTYACTLTNPTRAHDLVSEAFARVYRLMLAGKGPETAFGAYLSATIRSVNVDSLRRTGREIPVDEVSAVGREPVTDGTQSHAECDTILRALRSLPQRWQNILWATAVEGRSAKELGCELSLAPNSVSVLAVRAREGLKQAYLSQHIEVMPEGVDCGRYARDLARYTRRSLAPKRQSLVAAHVQECRECARVVSGLDGINRRLSTI